MLAFFQIAAAMIQHRMFRDLSLTFLLLAGAAPSLAAQQDGPILSAEREFERVESAGRSALAVGRYAEALAIAHDAYAFAEREFGPAHVLTLRGLNDLAVVHQVRRDYASALPLALQAVGGLERVAGGDHPETLNALANLAQLYIMMERKRDAEPLLRRVLAGRSRTLGADNEATLQSLLELAIFMNGEGRLREIAAEVRRGAEIARTALGEENGTARDLSDAAAAAQRAG